MMALVGSASPSTAFPLLIKGWDLEFHRPARDSPREEGTGVPLHQVQPNQSLFFPPLESYGDSGTAGPHFLC